MIRLLLAGLLLPWAKGLQDPGDFCGSNAYLQHVESFRIRSKVDVSVNFDLIRNDLTRLKADLDSYHQLLEVELQSTKQNKVNYTAEGYVQIDPIPKFAKYRYIKVTGKFDAAATACAKHNADLPIAPFGKVEARALVNIMKAYKVVEQPLRAVVEEATGVRDVTSGILVQQFTTSYTKDKVKTRPVLQEELDGGELKPIYKNSALTDIDFDFLCALPQKAHATSLRSMTHFVSTISKAKAIKQQFDVWLKQVLEFTKQDELMTMANTETDLKLNSPLHLKEVMDLTEELSVAPNYVSMEFPLLAALKEHNNAMLQLFSDLRVVNKLSVKVQLSHEELVALAKALKRPELDIRGHVVLSKRDERRCDLEYYDHGQEVNLAVYNVWPLLDSEFRLLEDKYLVQDQGSYYTTNEFPIPVNCFLDDDHVQTCSAPVYALADEQDHNCGDFITAHASNQFGAGRTNIGQCRMITAGADEWHRNVQAEQIIIPSICTRGTDKFTLVNLKKGDIDISCQDMRQRSVQLPIGNYELPKTCKLVRGDRVVHAVGRLSSRIGKDRNITQDTALIDKFLADFEIRDQDETIWNMDTFWIIFGGLCAFFASAASAAALMFCRNIGKELGRATSVDRPAARGRQAEFIDIEEHPFARYARERRAEAGMEPRVKSSACELQELEKFEKQLAGSRRSSLSPSDIFTSTPRSTTMSRAGSVLMITEINPANAI